jgi:hypothetical protein
MAPVERTTAPLNLPAILMLPIVIFAEDETLTSAPKLPEMPSPPTACSLPIVGALIRSHSKTPTCQPSVPTC